MKFRFIFIALFLIKFAASQSTFFVQTQATNIFNFPSDFLVKPDNHILFLNSSIDDNSNIYTNEIFEVSAEGEILNILTFTDTTSLYVTYTHILLVEDTLYVFGFGQKNLPGSIYPYFLMLKLDLQLNVINSSEIRIELPGAALNGFMHGKVKQSDSTFVYFSSCQVYNVITCFYVEISRRGELITIGSDNENTGQQIPYDFIQKPNKDGFVTFTFVNAMPGYVPGGFMYDYNNKLDVNSFSPLANNFYFYFNTLPIDDSTFYLSGTWIESNPLGYPCRTGIMKMKIDGTVLDQKLFVPPLGTDTADNTAYRNALDYLPDGNLILCSNHNIVIQQFPQQRPSYLRLIKLTPDLDVLWERFIGDGDGKYDAFSMKATPDDEIIIFGAWSPSPPVNWHYTELLFVKTNGEGLFTNINDDIGIKSSEAIIYPNPASNQVTVDFSLAYSLAGFQLSDMSGKTVYKTQLTANRQTIDISALPAGTYVYRIFNQKGLEETGKLVVE